MSAHQRLNQIVSELHDLPVRVWVIPDYFSLTLHKAGVFDFAGIPMLDLRAPALNEYQRMTKRSFDLILSVLCFPFWLLAMAIISLAIRLDSLGPVIFKQKRVGENGQLFTMLKFRTMSNDAESKRKEVEKRDENGNRILKQRDDPRVTRVGKLLRKTSLDEIPQLLNVLDGSMSLVGPRPELPDFVDEYKPWQRKRFAVPVTVQCICILKTICIMSRIIQSGWICRFWRVLSGWFCAEKVHIEIIWLNIRT